ncbi:hypothetical protein L195_g054850 [Trifolium pratense]|uniref:Uncharacterized protein n=1 Tax=Trifolium pratense TaxID=57577 RepID=A0A2K3KIE4_TRIPR|nr:hypothetical protein L195_g054850 [Trifolium pratense]
MIKEENNERKSGRGRSTLPEPAMAITVREGLEEETDKRRLESKKELVGERESSLGEGWRRRPMES